MFTRLLCCFVTLVAVFTDVTIDFLVMMVTVITRVANALVSTFVIMVNQGYQRSFFAINVTRTRQ